MGEKIIAIFLLESLKKSNLFSFIFSFNKNNILYKDL